MKQLLSYLLASLIGVVAHGQYWKSMGGGSTGIGTSEIRTLYADTVTDRLLAGGVFFKISNEEDTVWAFGQAVWNGTRWDSLATRIQPDNTAEVSPETYWFLRYQGSLYACGNFYFPTPGGYNKNIAKLNEQTQQWEALGCDNTGVSDLKTLVPKEPQGTLYATGNQGDLCGLFPPSCVYQYDGTTFTRWEPFDQIPEVVNRHVSYIFDYKGKTYMVGVFPDPTGTGGASFLRYNGTAWEHVPGWDNLMASIWDYSIRNDTLYVAGDFLTDTGGPGNLVASFDGEQWNNMGGGLHCEACWYPTEVKAIQWFHGELWACGMFDRIMDKQAYSIAKWNGHQWCAPPGDFEWGVLGGQGKLYDMAVWRDSLYVCGRFITVDDDTVPQVAQWIGGNAVAECGSGVGVSELQGPGQELVVIPGGGEGGFSVRFPHPGNWTVDVYDAMGTLLRKQNANGAAMVLDLSRSATGIYLLRARSAKGELRKARVLSP